MGNLEPLHVVTFVMFTLGASHMVYAWGMHRSKMPHVPVVLGLAACLHFMFVLKDYFLETLRALVRFGLIDIGPRFVG